MEQKFVKIVSDFSCPGNEKDGKNWKIHDGELWEEDGSYGHWTYTFCRNGSF